MSTPDRDPNRAKGRDSGEGSRRGQGSPESEQGSGGVLTNIQRRLGEAFCASRTDAVETGQNVPEAEPIPPQLPGGTQTVVPAAAGQTIPQFQSDVPGPSRQPGRDGTRPTAAQTLAAHVPERSPYNASVVSHQRRSKSPPTTRPNSQTQNQPQNSAEEWIREKAYERPARRQTGPEFVPAPVHVPPTPPPNETEHDYSTALDRWGRPITGAFVGRNLGGGHAANARQKAYQQNPFAAFGQQSGLPRTSPTITAVNPPPPPANTRTGGFTALLNTGILDGTVPVGATRARALSYDSQTNVILQGIQQTREQNPLRADSTDSQDTVREGELKSLASPDLSPEDRQLVIDRYLARRELKTRQLLWHRGEYPRHASVRPEAEIMEAIDDEVDDIIKDMISGAKRNTSGPPEASLVHKAFQKQPEIEREFQNMIEVYKAFWRGVPRHINLNCNQDRDPFDCCWFLYFRKLALLSPENDDMREHYMLNRLRADIVRLCMKFIDTTLTRILSWPNFCRKILWDWRLENTRRAADGEYVINFPRGEDMDRLIRETGLTEQAVIPSTESRKSNESILSIY